MSEATNGNEKAASESVPKPEIRRPPVLFSRTQPLVRRIEERLGGRLLTYWCSQSASMGHTDVLALEQVLRGMEMAEGERVMLFIKSDGGAGTAALRMTNILRHHASHVTALVPRECASAATMLALGADEIHIGPLGHLTAVDTSVRHELSPTTNLNERVSVSQDELSRVARLWNGGPEADGSKSNAYEHLFGHIHPLVIGAVDRASSLSIKLCTEILSYHLDDPAKAAEIARRLNEDYPSHSYPITLREAQRIGLDVRPLESEIDELLLELAELYSEMGQKAETDFDECNYHSNEIRKIVEAGDVQLYYQVDLDWHYRKEERRWSSLNDRSAWRRIEQDGKEEKTTVCHFR
jgi:hypothetical protein